jgi:hemerythrin-like domain-containing protein
MAFQQKGGHDMNIDRFKRQHVDILDCIATLRNYVKDGIVENATQISLLIVSMSSTIKLHLAVEDNLLYPALQETDDPALASLGKRFQDEMKNIASSYLAFARTWNSAPRLLQNPEGFRSDANRVLKMLHQRMQNENTSFYPAIEAH